MILRTVIVNTKMSGTLRNLRYLPLFKSQLKDLDSSYLKATTWDSEVLSNHRHKMSNHHVMQEEHQVLQVLLQQLLRKQMQRSKWSGWHT